MANREIVKAVLRETMLFGGKAYVWAYTSRTEVKIVSPVVFVRLSDLVSLKLFIKEKGGRVKDIEVSPMPAMDNRLSVVVVFEK
jgi:fructose-1,6-bisphosphatase/inositol monophosphatase family enzyme